MYSIIEKFNANYFSKVMPILFCGFKLRNVAGCSEKRACSFLVVIKINVCSIFPMCCVHSWSPIPWPLRQSHPLTNSSAQSVTPSSVISRDPSSTVSVHYDWLVCGASNGEKWTSQLCIASDPLICETFISFPYASE